MCRALRTMPPDLHALVRFAWPLGLAALVILAGLLAVDYWLTFGVRDFPLDFGIGGGR